jgi:hemerythrin
MEYLTWTDDMLIGVEEIDGHHKKLLETMNRAYTACMLTKSDAEIKDIFNELVGYVKYHFQAEEQLMEQYGCPGLMEQKQEHTDFINKINELVPDIAAINLLPIGNLIELTQFLINWFEKHVLGVDKKIGIYLKTLPDTH